MASINLSAIRPGLDQSVIVGLLNLVCCMAANWGDLHLQSGLEVLVQWLEFWFSFEVIQSNF